jgi:hypothetical protein
MAEFQLEFFCGVVTQIPEFRKDYHLIVQDRCPYPFSDPLRYTVIIPFFFAA